MMDKVTAIKITGGLSSPSKMPGFAYGIPAEACKTGSALVKIPGSVCSKCYALKNFYRMPNVKASLNNRLSRLNDPLWVEAMVFLIMTVPEKHRAYFRWHDSGDLQGLWHLELIVEIARRLPDIKFWLPTREKSMVREFTGLYGIFPKNLVVRVSGTMIDGPAPAGFANTSTVETVGGSCPARYQNNKCGGCRACWDPEVANVSYHAH